MIFWLVKISLCNRIVMAQYHVTRSYLIYNHLKRAVWTGNFNYNKQIYQVYNIA